MKKIFLIVGIVLIILLAGVWAYLLFFSTGTTNNNLFTIFDFDDTTDDSVSLNNLPTLEEEPVVDILGNEPLRQLTTKPVVGSSFVQENASSTEFIYFVEAGTGHVFSINTESGEEVRISNITIPQANEAVVSGNGRYVAVASGVGFDASLTIVSLPTGSSTLRSYTLPEYGEDLFFTAENELLYSKSTATSRVGAVYNPVSNSIRTLFEIPFESASLEWGPTAEAIHYAYPKPSSELEGYLYSFTGNVMRRKPVSGFGFSAAVVGDTVLYSKKVNGEYKSFITNLIVGETTPLDQTIVPERCSPIFESESFLCAKTDYESSTQLPDDWLVGDVESRDVLLSVDFGGGIESEKLDLYKQTNRQFGAEGIVINNDQTRILFTNNTDRSLWFYDLLVN